MGFTVEVLQIMALSVERTSVDADAQRGAGEFGDMVSDPLQVVPSLGRLRLLQLVPLVGGACSERRW